MNVNDVPKYLKKVKAATKNSLDDGQRIEVYELLLALQAVPDNEEMNNELCLFLEPLLSILRRDMYSKNEELAGLAMKALGYFLHHKTFVAACTDESARANLLAVEEIITTTNMKRLCSLGAWCLSQQQLPHELVSPHVASMVMALIHAVDNPMGSLAVAVEAFQALIKLVNSHPDEMCKESVIWAPLICRQMLSEEKMKGEHAEKLLIASKGLLLPAPAPLSVKLVIELNNSLLLRMEAALKDPETVLMVLRAWAWIVRLLGRKLVEKNTDGQLMVNCLLKIPESTFLSPDQPVRIATQVAWQALIDNFIAGGAAPGGKGGKTLDINRRLRYEEMLSRIGNQLGITLRCLIRLTCKQELSTVVTQPSSKRLALLMMPLTNSMLFENDLHVRMACFRTWGYLLNRLEDYVTSPTVFEVIVQPMLDVILRKNPESEGSLIWLQATRLLEDLLSARLHKNDGQPQNSGTTIWSKGNMEEGENSNGDNSYEAGVLEICTSLRQVTVKWGAWNLEQTDGLLKLLALVMKGEWREPTIVAAKNGVTGVTVNNRSLTLWKLLVRGIEAAGRADVRPAQEHVTAVHSLLRFMHQVCVRDAFITSFKDEIHCHQWMQYCWQLMDTLIMELKPLILSSSFYKLPIVEKGEAAIAGRQNNVVQSGPGPIREGSVDILSGDSIVNSSDSQAVKRGPPGFYLASVWLQAALQKGSPMGPLEQISSQFQKLVAVGMKGQEEFTDIAVMVSVLEWLSLSGSKETGTYKRYPVSGSFSKRSSANEEVCERDLGWSPTDLILGMWRAIAVELCTMMAESNDIKDFGSNRPDSGHQVLQGLFLLPFNCIYLANQCNVSASSIELTGEQWGKLLRIVHRIATLKSAHPNALVAKVFQGILSLLEDRQHETTKERLSPSSQSPTSNYKGDIFKLLVAVTSQASGVVETQSSAVAAITKQRRKHSSGNGSTLGDSVTSTKTVGGKAVIDSNCIGELFSVVSRLLDTSRSPDYRDEAKRMLLAVGSLASRFQSSNDVLLLSEAVLPVLEKWLRTGWDPNASLSSQVSEETQLPQTITLEQELLDLLERCWKSLLLGLQKCHPRLQFDSGLLSLLASTLSVAFLHPCTSLANVTVEFWEKTFGKIGASIAGKSGMVLSYPSCLVPVLKVLKRKSTISFPCWNPEVETNGNNKDAEFFDGMDSNEKGKSRAGPKSRPKALVIRNARGVKQVLLNSEIGKVPIVVDKKSSMDVFPVVDPLAAAKPWVGKTGSRILQGFLHEQETRRQEAMEATHNAQTGNTEWKPKKENECERISSPNQMEPDRVISEGETLVTQAYQGSEKVQLEATEKASCSSIENPENSSTPKSNSEVKISDQEGEKSGEVGDGESSARTRGLDAEILKSPEERRRLSTAFLYRSLGITFEKIQPDSLISEENAYVSFESPFNSTSINDEAKNDNNVEDNVDDLPSELTKKTTNGEDVESLKIRKRHRFQQDSPGDYTVVPGAQKKAKVHLTQHQKEVKAAQKGQGPEVGGGGMVHGTGGVLNGTTEGSLQNNMWWEDTQDTRHSGSQKVCGSPTLPESISCKKRGPSDETPIDRREENEGVFRNGERTGTCVRTVGFIKRQKATNGGNSSDMPSESSGGKWKELSRITSGTSLSRCNFIQSSMDRDKQERGRGGEREGETTNVEKKFSGAVESASGRQEEDEDIGKEKGFTVLFDEHQAKQRRVSQIGSGADFENQENISNPEIISKVGASNPMGKVPNFCESQVSKDLPRAVEKEIGDDASNEVESRSRPFQLTSDVPEGEVKINSDNVEETMTEQECEETQQVVYLTPETVPYGMPSQSTPVELNSGLHSRTEEVVVGLGVEETTEVKAVEDLKEAKMKDVDEEKTEAKQVKGEEVDPGNGEEVEGEEKRTKLGTKALPSDQLPIPTNDVQITDSQKHFVQANRIVKSMVRSPTSSPPPPPSEAILSKPLTPCVYKETVQKMWEVKITTSDSRHPQMRNLRKPKDSELTRRETVDSMIERLKQVSSDLRSNLGKRKFDDNSLVDLLDEHGKLATAMEEISTLQTCLASSSSNISASLRKRLGKKAKKERKERRVAALMS